MSNCSYNGVPIPYLFTEEFAHQPEPDPTGVDSMWTKTSLKVRGVIAPGLVPALVGESPYQTAARIAGLLSVPRRRLVYVQGTTTVIDTGVAGDAENGPWPEVFSVDPCPTEGGFVVHFGVTLKRLLCTGAAARGFVSLKWSDLESHDLRGAKTRRRSGMLILSRLFRPNADDRRNLVSRAEIYMRMAARGLPSVKHGKRRLIPKKALVEMLAKGLRQAV
ncbi:helix-turn-helix domain-containing protein [bacterium]|nr:helix-turn-helix domain-containing protein [bacterium]